MSGVPACSESKCYLDCVTAPPECHVEGANGSTDCSKASCGTIVCPTSDAGGDGEPHTSLDAASAAGQCHWPESLNDAGPGACAVGYAYVDCRFPSGAGCLCISNDPTSCPGCGPGSGATCENRCASNEYAVSCGGPPRLLPDGGFASYQQAPDACVGIAGTPGGNLYSCCPCE